MGKIPTETQVSAGGVAFRRRGKRIEVALISVGEDARWQLPKGIVGRGESPENAALREVREEAGIETELAGSLDQIEYWYYSSRQGRRIRFHKFVYFFLMTYRAGDVRDHDQEVNEARWVEIGKAQDMLAFDSERKVVRRAQEVIESKQSRSENT